MSDLMNNVREYQAELSIKIKKFQAELVAYEDSLTESEWHKCRKYAYYQQGVRDSLVDAYMVKINELLEKYGLNDGYSNF